MAEQPWEGFIAFEDQETGDGRCFSSGALVWETPVPLNWTHNEYAATVGTIETIERLDGGVIYGKGVFFDSEAGRTAAAECQRHTARGMDHGVSVDLDDVSMELRVRKEVYDEQAAALEEIIGDGEEAPAKDEPEVDAKGRIKVEEMKTGDYVTVLTAGRIRAASMVSIPAFADAYVRLVADEVAPVEDVDPQEMPVEDDDTVAAVEAVESLVAGAFPVAPPASWFDDPGLTEATAIQITDEGRIFGHGATWGTFHIGFAGRKINAPRSRTNYAYFKTGAVRTDEGVDIATGRITMRTGHAEGDLGPLDAMAHYDNTAAVVADITCGEDQFGIWVSGALRPDVTPEQVRELRGAPLSGDWREISRNLELVALLAVNTAGFPIPRMGALVASGEVRSLTASASFETEGVQQCDVETCGCQPSTLSVEEQVELQAMLAERAAAREALAAETAELTAEVIEGINTQLGDAESKRARVLAARKLARVESAKLKALRNL